MREVQELIDNTPGHDPYRTPPIPGGGDPRSVPYSGQSRMALLIGGGLAGAYLRIDPDATALIRVDAGAGRGPRMRVDGDVIHLDRDPAPSFTAWIGLWFAGARSDLAIALHPAVHWQLQIRGGVSHLQADLTAGRIGSVVISGGCSDVALDLPRPEHATAIRIGGGASGVRVRRPSDVGLSVSIDGGAVGLRLDDQYFRAIGGPARLHAAGGVAGQPGYELAVAGGGVFVEVERAR
jgi:hypothetical protein